MLVNDKFNVTISVLGKNTISLILRPVISSVFAFCIEKPLVLILPLSAVLFNPYKHSVLFVLCANSADPDQTPQNAPPDQSPLFAYRMFHHNLIKMKMPDQEDQEEKEIKTVLLFLVSNFCYADSHVRVMIKYSRLHCCTLTIVFVGINEKY